MIARILAVLIGMTGLCACILSVAIFGAAVIIFLVWMTISGIVAVF